MATAAPVQEQRSTSAGSLRMITRRELSCALCSKSPDPAAGATSGRRSCLFAPPASPPWPCSCSSWAVPPHSTMKGAAPAPNGQQQQAAVPNGQHAINVGPPPRLSLEEFEHQVCDAKRRALLVASLHILSRILGLCALTWATVVLLGGFASDLRLLDFHLVSLLILLEAIRLFIIRTFSKLLSRPLFREPVVPGQFTFRDEQPVKVSFLDLIGQCLSLILANMSLVGTSIRLIIRHSHDLSERNPSNDGHSNLPISLWTFYVLAIINSALACLSSLLRPLLRPGSLMSFRQSSPDSPEQQDTLMCFYNEVYKTSVEAGLPEADQLDFLDFAFGKIASDIKRNIRPFLVRERNRDMISYLYKGQHGIAMACDYLKGRDLWRRVAAALLPGLWQEEKNIKSQTALFWGLRDIMYGAGKDSESAFYSVQWLAQAWEPDLKEAGGCGRPWPDDVVSSRPHPFLINDPSTGTNVVDTMVDVILEPIRPTMVFQVRALEACCRDPRVIRHLYAEYASQLMQVTSRSSSFYNISYTELPRELDRQISAVLQRMVVKEGRQQEALAQEIEAQPPAPALLRMTCQQAAGRHPPLLMSRLENLCIKLLSLVGAGGSSNNSRMVTKIYASKLLLSLLLYGSPRELGADTIEFLRRIVDTRIGGQTIDARKDSYFSDNDIDTLEMVRCWLGLGDFHAWNQVRVVELRTSKAVTNLQKINRIVNDAKIRAHAWRSCLL